MSGVGVDRQIKDGLKEDMCFKAEEELTLWKRKWDESKRSGRRTCVY